MLKIFFRRSATCHVAYSAFDDVRGCQPAKKWLFAVISTCSLLLVLTCWNNIKIGPLHQFKKALYSHLHDNPKRLRNSAHHSSFSGFWSSLYSRSQVRVNVSTIFIIWLTHRLIVIIFIINQLVAPLSLKIAPL